MILVDSSVWIDFFNGAESPQVAVLDASLGEVPILVGDLIMTEVLQGFWQTRDFNAAKTALEQFECRDMLGRDIALAERLERPPPSAQRRHASKDHRRYHRRVLCSERRSAFA